MFLLSGSACAMFYPRPKDNTGLGKRSFFTSANGNHYPRIGRRDASGTSLLLPDTDYTDLGDFIKRGVFTQGPHGSYPRVGRSGIFLSKDYMNEGNKNLEKVIGDKDDAVEMENGDASRRTQVGNSGIPLDILFIAYDSDNDGKLSKDEFLSGLSQYQRQCPPY